MEIQMRRHRTVQIQDQENIYANKGKSNLALPVKKQGLSVRGALGEVNSNVQAQRDVAVGKVAYATAEFEKKATLTRAAAKCNTNYSHVQSKVDTGRATKPVIQPSSRPPLRREESTANLAAKAAARSKAAFKEISGNRNNEIIFKKDSKKSSKLSSVKEVKPDETRESTLKPIIKEQTQTLQMLSLESDASTDDECSSLPSDIEDIDAGDNSSPLLMSMYIKDIYRYLIELEEKYPVGEDYLKNQSVITGKMRATLMDWLVEVQRQFSLLLETFQLTVGIIDRYLQAVPNVQRNELQLVGVTAMFIASKYEEIYAPDVGDFVYVTDNAYSKQDVFRCEREIMCKLGFCLARPIPLSFLRRFIKAAHGSSKNHHLAKYLVDLCLVDYNMSHYRPSELAAAAICLSLHLLSSKKLPDIWTPTLVYYSGYTFAHIQPIMRKIAVIVISAETSKYKAVYNKYLDTSLAKVSSLPQLKGEAIYELVKITE
ncbi:G2/mitotic-specific cyclin-B [Plutella xylostella]|uniref:G2/mitotic-specific cyclin-B n=1 Tax=Plutella xylostella TaxID=51655 RepID=UPI0020330EBF|nr:G2/mitotic-specific cyclin-B [Plutella xylostella]